MVHSIVALQTGYSLWTRDIEAGILPACRELGITLVARGEDVVATCRTKRVARLEENAEASDVRLSADEVEAIAAALPAVHGNRYSERAMRAVNR